MHLKGKAAKGFLGQDDHCVMAAHVIKDVLRVFLGEEFAQAAVDIALDHFKEGCVDSGAV